MKLSTVRRILKENLGGDLPAWLDKFLEPLNQFIEQSFVAINGNLTFADNMLCKVTTQELTHDTVKEVNPGSKLKVQGVLFISAEGEMLTGTKWVPNSDGNVAVTVQFGAGAGTKADVKLIFLFG
jgi:hypothetical protein